MGRPRPRNVGIVEGAVVRVLAVTGSRDFGVVLKDGFGNERETWPQEQGLMNYTLENAPPFDLLVAGDADGADAFCLLWAKLNRVNHACCYADWTEYGNAAGPIRNRFMLENFKPFLLYAFPGGRGTANCVKTAKQLGIEVVHLTTESQGAQK